MWILLPPLCDVRLVPLVALKEMILAKMRQNVRALLRHQHARIFRIGQVNFRNLLRVVLSVSVEFRDQPLVKSHARPARVRRVAGIDARHHGKRVVALGHRRRRHAQQNAIRIHQPDHAGRGA